MTGHTGLSRYVVILVLPCFISAASAQVHSTREAATTYGARLNAQEMPNNINQHRINNRNASRINNRLSLRIERYKPDSTNNPGNAYVAAQSDGSRNAPIVAPLPSPQNGE